jgi:hypothetical protein
VSINNDASHYVYTLTYTISFIPQPTMRVSVHNQHSDFRLTDGGWFNAGASWNKEPKKGTDVDNMTSVELIPFLSIFEGVMTYELRRKDIEFDDQHEPTYVRLFVAWKSEGYKKFHLFIHLTEYNESMRWNEVMLKECYYNHINRLNIYTDPIKDTWLIPDDTVLVTELELDFTQRDGVLNITISKGVEDEHTRRPEWINLGR